MLRRSSTCNSLSSRSMHHSDESRKKFVLDSNVEERLATTVRPWRSAEPSLGRLNDIEVVELGDEPGRAAARVDSNGPASRLEPRQPPSGVRGRTPNPRKLRPDAMVTLTLMRVLAYTRIGVSTFAII